jgi:hypothetical protein
MGCVVVVVMKKKVEGIEDTRHSDKKQGEKMNVEGNFGETSPLFIDF